MNELIQFNLLFSYIPCFSLNLSMDPQQSLVDPIFKSPVLGDICITLVPDLYIHTCMGTSLTWLGFI